MTEAHANSREIIPYRDGFYRSEQSPPGLIARTFPSGRFYCRFIADVLRSAREAKRGHYDRVRWSESSLGVMRALEKVGVNFEISGVESVRDLDSPCVFVGNHMSTLETMVLPAIIQPIRDVTFVVKQSLLEYPVFRHIVGSRDPIGVTRQNPRDDFKAVMQGGLERLGNGISIVVFPQTTRSVTFDAEQFNSIGTKLAVKAGVPIVPIALKTDAWGNGKRIKDFGPIDPNKTVHLCFGPPMAPEGRGAKQHDAAIAFIESKLARWNQADS